MAYCEQCGQQIDERAAFCTYCGKARQTGAAANPGQPGAAAQQGGAHFAANMQNLTNTKDRTAEFHPQDIQQNKGITVCAYLGILVLIPIFAAKESRFARFHSNQGLLLLILGLIVGVFNSIMGAIFLAISWRLYFLITILSLLWIPIAILAIMGIINVVNGKAKELPLIGGFKILN